MERATFTKAERQYIQGIVHNYSLQRWTDQDIVDYLREEKKIKIGRSTVTKIKNQVEQQAHNWYIQLRESGSKYVAVYKERLDSLLSYQKKLHDIISASEKPEVQVRAISELHSIEMSIFSLFKELPQFDIVPDKTRTVAQCNCKAMSKDTFIPNVVTVTKFGVLRNKTRTSVLTLIAHRGLRAVIFNPMMSIING